MSFINYYRKLTFQLSKTAYLLNQLLKKKKNKNKNKRKKKTFNK